jgi:SAM-dependent methyltransferase
MSGTVSPHEDAWGAALLDHFHGREVPTPQLEVDTGETGPAMHPEWFFRSFDDWDWWDQELLPLIETGPVLDLGAGAGRAALYLQDRGIEVTAVDSSPGAVEVCRRRGVRDVRLADLSDALSDRRWAAILLLCGNLGLGGSWDGSRQLLTRLAQQSAPGAILIGDSVDPRGPGEIRLRIRYRDLVTPWWKQRNVSKSEIPALVHDTGWQIERQLEDGVDHAVLLRNRASSSQ